MANFRFDHIHLRSTDPEAMAQWFERILGGEVKRTMQQGKPRIDVRLGGADIFIAPVADGDGTSPAPVTPCRGLDHFGLFVDDIDAVVADLTAKGVQFSIPLHSPRPGIFFCFIRGPEGISIEILERKPAA